MLEKWIEVKQAKGQLQAVETARGLLTCWGDEPFPSATAPVEARIIAQTPEAALLAAESNDVLNQAIAEYKKNPFSPEAVTNYWRAKLQADGKRMGLNISTPDCNWTEDEIKKPMIDEKGKEVPSMMIYVPQELTGQEGLEKLGQMYPKMESWSVQKGTTVQGGPDANKKEGWVKVEATVDAPNLNTTQGDLEKHAKKQGYFIQRENAYILASQASKDLTGHYLDEGSTRSRLGSRHGSDVVLAYFYSDGDLDVYWYLHPQDHHPFIGGRFEEVRKA